MPVVLAATLKKFTSQRNYVPLPSFDISLVKMFFYIRVADVIGGVNSTNNEQHG